MDYIRQAKILQLLPYVRFSHYQNIFTSAQLSAVHHIYTPKKCSYFSFRKFSSRKVFGRVKTEIINFSSMALPLQNSRVNYSINKHLTSAPVH